MIVQKEAEIKPRARWIHMCDSPSQGRMEGLIESLSHLPTGRAWNANHVDPEASSGNERSLRGSIIVTTVAAWWAIATWTTSSVVISIGVGSGDLFD